jgi:hypothetical protein
MIQPHSIVFNAACGQALAAYTAYAKLFNIIIPANYKVIGVTLIIGRKGGTYSVATLDVTVGGTTILGAVFDVAAAVAGTAINKEVANLAAGAASIAADAVLNVVTTESGGTSPTWGDVTLQIDVVPIGS